MWTIAAARLVLPEDVAVQAPPNLSGDFARLLDAGIDDWGGVSPVTIDHVNPEAPWPEVEALRAACASRGLELAPRLTVYPRFLGGEWLDPAVLPKALRASDSLGLAREDAWSAGSPGDVPFVVSRDPLPLAVAGELGEDEIARLFRARGSERQRVFAEADALRREVNGDTVSYVVTRNVQYTNVCYFRCGFCAFSKGKLAANLRGAPYLVPHEEIVRRAEEAWERGATEICLQGGIHPAFDGDYYASVVRAIKDAVPELHVHAFSALEIWQGAATLGVPLRDYLERLRDEGLSSLPGTAAEVLDDEVRAVICPDKITTAQWLEVHETAHAVGLRSNNTIMFGHVDGPVAWARHLVAVRDAARRTGGFTEFVPLPFIHMEAPIYLRGRARPGPTWGETLLMHAVGRLALHPWITNVQVSWVKAGPQGAVEALNAGVNDLGGTLMNESISRAAGSEWGQEMSPERMEALIRSAGRIPRQRTTLYGDAPRRAGRALVRRRAARRAVEPARERGAARTAAHARAAAEFRARAAGSRMRAGAGLRIVAPCSTRPTSRRAPLPSRRSKPAAGKPRRRCLRWTLRIVVAGDRACSALAQLRPVRPLATRTTRVLAEPPVGLAADAGARAQKVRASTAGSNLAASRRWCSNVVPISWLVQTSSPAAGRISTSATCDQAVRRAPAKRSSAISAARCRTDYEIQHPSRSSRASDQQVMAASPRPAATRRRSAARSAEVGAASSGTPHARE